MATCIPFQSQLSSIMEVLVKAAVAEISKLVDDKCAFLHHEISCKQSEIETLKRKLVMMESKTAQLQRGFENYMDRGTDAATNCPQPSADIKFPEMEEATVSFTIKEESPDETLWIRDSAGQVGSALQYSNLGYLAGSQQLEENHQLSHADVSRQKNPEFGGELYASGHPATTGDVGGLQFTVKTEKEDQAGGYGQGGCQHGAGKPSRLASADFSSDERDNQLWSSLIDGHDIDAGFPDFSSVVDEYSNAFPSNSQCSSGKAGGAQQRQQQQQQQRQRQQQQQQQQQCNGGYSSDFQPHCAELQQDGQEEQSYPQREDAGEGRQTGHGPHPSHHHQPQSQPQPPPPGAARSPYVCPQCGKQFGRLHQFKLHQQSHRRKWAFWCTVCGKNFQCSSHLSIHHRTHTGERPYGCGQCGKRFTQQSSLRVHQRTHSGERPYSCTLCGKTFILMHHLKRHRIIHTYS